MDDKPKKFWDGFQWVDTDNRTVMTQQGAIGQATRKDRRLYVGNLPIGAGLTEKQISEFITSSMKQRGMMTEQSPDPVLSVWLSPEATYAFVEFHTVEAANNALGLNGLTLLTQQLRISRPNNYQPTVGHTLDDIVAMNANAVAGGAPQGGVAALPQAAAAVLVPNAAAAAAAVPPAAPPAPTATVLCCANMLTAEELRDAAEREGLKEDVTEEVVKHGVVKQIKIPVAGNSEGRLYIQFETAAAAAATLRALTGRKFDGRVVTVTTMPESDFASVVDGA